MESRIFDVRFGRHGTSLEFLDCVDKTGLRRALKLLQQHSRIACDRPAASKDSLDMSMAAEGALACPSPESMLVIMQDENIVSRHPTSTANLGSGSRLFHWSLVVLQTISKDN